MDSKTNVRIDMDPYVPIIPRVRKYNSGKYTSGMYNPENNTFIFDGACRKAVNHGLSDGSTNDPVESFDDFGYND